MSCITQSSGFDLKSPIAVVAHDAGAANLIAAWLKDMPTAHIRICVAGPALDIFAGELPHLTNMRLTKVLDGAATLLSGTSSQVTNIEHEARVLARERGIRSIGVIDHWVNYNQRFVRGGCQALPDEIWVTDEYALSLARTCFPRHLVHQLRNRYLEQQVDLINSKSARQLIHSRSHVLYVLEPIVERWGKNDVPGEFQALDFFIEQMALLGLGKDTEICLRPHPSEAADKYNTWCKLHHDLNILVDTTGTLSDLIAWADWVVGCQTVAMVIAHHAKRRAISTLPPLAPNCMLPQKEIRMLRDLYRKNKIEIL